METLTKNEIPQIDREAMPLSFWYKESALSLNNQENVRRLCKWLAATLRPFLHFLHF